MITGMMFVKAMEFEDMSLYENIQAKRKRIKAGSGETMRKPGQKGRPTAKHFAEAKKTAKNKKTKKT